MVAVNSISRKILPVVRKLTGKEMIRTITSTSCVAQDAVNLTKGRFVPLSTALKLLGEDEFRHNHIAQYCCDGKVILTQRNRASKDLAEFIDHIKTGRFIKPNQAYNTVKSCSPKAIECSNNLAKSIIETNEHFVDGFRYQGPHAIFDSTGKNISRHFSGDAEKIIIDKTHDLTLSKTILAFKKRLINGNYTEEQKMSELMKFVDEIFSVDKSGSKIEKFVSSFESADKEFYLGDIIKSGAGVCRHKALMTKLLGDEIGLQTRIIQGYYRGSGHAWNEVLVGDKTFLFDGALRQIFDVSKKGNLLPAEVLSYRLDIPGIKHLVPRYLEEGSPIHRIYASLQRKMPLKTSCGTLSPTASGYKFIPNSENMSKITIDSIHPSGEMIIPKGVWVQTEKNGFQII